MLQAGDITVHRRLAGSSPIGDAPAAEALAKNATKTCESLSVGLFYSSG